MTTREGRCTHRKLGAELEEVLDWRAVGALEVGQGAVVGLVVQGRRVLNVGYRGGD